MKVAILVDAENISYRYAKLILEEAASLGTVPAVGNTSSIPEVCAECALYFNPYDVDDISRVIAAALKNDSVIQEKKMQLENQLNKFSWEENAKETVKVYLGNE